MHAEDDSPALHSEDPTHRAVAALDLTGKEECIIAFNYELTNDEAVRMQQVIEQSHPGVAFTILSNVSGIAVR